MESLTIPKGQPSVYMTSAMPLNIAGNHVSIAIAIYVHSSQYFPSKPGTSDTSPYRPFGPRVSPSAIRTVSHTPWAEIHLNFKFRPIGI